MKNKNFLKLMVGAVALAGALGFTHTAQALEDRVVAVVNDDVLTLTQLDTRVNLAAEEMGLDKDTLSAQQRATLRKRTLSGMIDEILVSEAAKGRGLSVTPDELIKARAAMVQNGVPEAKIVALEKNYKQTFVDKLRADLLWEKTTVQVIRPRITVGTAEIDRVLENMLQNRQVLEREIGHIMLRNADGQDEATQARMEEILKQLEGGAKFEDVAKASSEDEATASAGGYMGWFTSGQLNPELEIALDRLKAGDFSGIIRTPDGWHILRLVNTRSTKPMDVKPVTEYQLYLAAYPAPETKEGTAALEKLAQDFRKPFEVQALFEKPADAGPASKVLGWVSLRDMAPEWQDVVSKAKIGTWTPVTTSGKTVGMVFVADTRETVPAELTQLREKVNQQLYGNRMELETRRYLRELRQRAFVDVRL